MTQSIEIGGQIEVAFRRSRGEHSLYTITRASKPAGWRKHIEKGLRDQVARGGCLICGNKPGSNDCKQSPKHFCPRCHRTVETCGGRCQNNSVVVELHPFEGYDDEMTYTLAATRRRDGRRSICRRIDHSRHSNPDGRELARREHFKPQSELFAPFDHEAHHQDLFDDMVAEAAAEEAELAAANAAADPCNDLGRSPESFLYGSFVDFDDDGIDDEDDSDLCDDDLYCRDCDRRHGKCICHLEDTREDDEPCDHCEDEESDSEPEFHLEEDGPHCVTCQPDGSQHTCVCFPQFDESVHDDHDLLSSAEANTLARRERGKSAIYPVRRLRRGHKSGTTSIDMRQAAKLAWLSSTDERRLDGLIADSICFERELEHPRPIRVRPPYFPEPVRRSWFSLQEELDLPTRWRGDHLLSETARSEWLQDE